MSKKIKESDQIKMPDSETASHLTLTQILKVQILLGQPIY